MFGSNVLKHCSERVHRQESNFTWVFYLVDNIASRQEDGEQEYRETGGQGASVKEFRLLPARQGTRG